MSKQKLKFICQECEYETGKWLGRCPSCGNFNSFTEKVVITYKDKIVTNSKPTLLKNIEPLNEKRIVTEIKEFDRVLGGGIIQGSLTLVGGDPGIGKSTLLLQACEFVGKKGKKVLYASGEESTNQIKLRATRLNVSTENLFIISENNLNVIINILEDINFDLIIIDSIQTMFLDEITSSPGSITQVRECTAKIMRTAKSKDISVFIVGHVTKDGALAGPRILEHMVDTVLYFEGEKLASYRILRSAKNRFGSTNEIGVFEMQKNGLIEIANPSEYMLSGRPINSSGSIVSCSIEGTRPILTEVQALTSYTTFNMPRRVATGVDFNRMVLLIAVLEKKLGLQLGSYDTYVNLAGGLKIMEPAIDSAIITAISSSYKNKSVDSQTLIFGEIGLAGEMRAVSFAEKRVIEAAKLGFKTVVLPKDNLKQMPKTNKIEIKGVSNVTQLLNLVI